jgi:CheY-like chemotaxis protein
MSQNLSSLPIEILLVEDSPTDALITQEALVYSKVLNKIHHVEDGVEALAFLRRQGVHADKVRPGLVLLDLNLPKLNGLEVLTAIKADPELRTIPVVVLTTSKSEKDIAVSYGMHANCFVTKPVDFVQFSHVVKSINDFWFSIVTLPPAQP